MTSKKGGGVMEEYKRALYELVKNINKDSSLRRLYKLALFLYLKEES